MLNPRISLFIGLISISIFPVLVKWAPVSGITSAFYRMAIGTLLLLPYMLFSGKLTIPARNLWMPIVLCGIIFGSDIAVWNMSIHYSNATQATLLTNLSPLWVGIASFLFLTEKPNPNFWIGTGIALAGLVILIGFDTLSEMRFNKGFGMAIVSGMLYASYMLISKKVLDKINIVNFLMFSMAVSSVYLLILCVFMKQPLWHFTPVVWCVFMVQGIVCQLLGWFTISYAIKKMDAGRVSLGLLSQSVVTGIMAWLFIGEKVTVQMIIGGIIILLGIGVTFRKPKKNASQS